MDMVLRHLPSGKSHGCDGLTNEVFKHYASILEGPLTLMFQHCWNSSYMPRVWKITLIKLIPKVTLLESFNQ